MAFTYSGSQAAAAALAKELGAEAIKADSADRQAVIDVVRSRGALDVLVVNSGVILFGDARTLDPDAVDHLIDVNVRAPYHASVEAAKRMNAGGHIIIIASVNGDRMAFAGAAAYALSKSALHLPTLRPTRPRPLPHPVEQTFRRTRSSRLPRPTRAAGQSSDRRRAPSR